MKQTKSIKSTPAIATIAMTDLRAVVGGVIADAPDDTTGDASGRRQHEPVVVIEEHGATPPR